MEKRSLTSKFGGYIQENDLNKFMDENKKNILWRSLRFINDKFTFILLSLLFWGSYFIWVDEILTGLMMYIFTGTISLIFMFYIDVIIYNKTTFFIILKNEDQYSIRGQLAFLGNYSKKWVTE